MTSLLVARSSGTLSLGAKVAVIEELVIITVFAIVLLGAAIWAFGRQE